MKKEEYEKELKSSLLDLREAWIRCLYIFGNIYHDCNDYITNNYPFDKSFDEIEVITWIDSTLENIEKNSKQEKDTIFIIEKNKTIPILKEYVTMPSNQKNIFDEEITFKTNSIYIDNKLRIIIEKNENSFNILSAAFEEFAGLSYWEFTLSNEDFKQFSTFEDFINKVFIKGIYNDEGTSIATGLFKENLKEKDITDDMF